MHRAAAVFDGVPSLLAALEALLADPDVTIVRVKNRLDPEHRPSATAGFRYNQGGERGWGWWWEGEEGGLETGARETARQASGTDRERASRPGIAQAAHGGLPVRTRGRAGGEVGGRWGRVVTGGRRERGRPPGFRYGPKRPKGARNQPPSVIGVEARACEIGLEARAVSAPAAAPRPTAAAVVRGASTAGRAVSRATGTEDDDPRGRG